MREIKFRAKYINEDNWCFGTGLIFGDNDVTIVRHIKDPFNKFNPLFSIIKKETICQFIGLQDKNGVDIYDGDIVKYINVAYVEEHEEQTQEIYFANATFMQGGLCLADLETIEVIGNVHEN